MQIVSVSKSKWNNGIFFATWEGLVNGIAAFAEGRTASSYATEEHQFEATVQSAGVEGGGLMAMFLDAVAPQLANFLTERILNPAQEQFKTWPVWHGSFDYDAMGTRFFKSSVTIRKTDDPEGYLLELNAAYVGGQVEDELAQVLGLPQALTSESVTVELTPDEQGNLRYEIAEVIQRLTNVFQGVDIIDPIVYFMRTQAMDRHDPKHIPVMIFNGETPLIVEMDLVGHERWVWKDGESEDRMVFSDDEGENPKYIITAPPDMTYDDPPKPRKPEVVFTIGRFSQERYNRLQLITETQKAHAEEIADQIVKAFLQ